MRVLQAMAGAEFGGAETFFERLAPALTRAGVEQRIVIRHDAARALVLRDAGLAPLELPFGGRFDFRTARRLAAEIDAFAPDIVLSWMNRASIVCARARIRASHGVPQIGRLGGYYKTKYYRGCDHLIGNTPDIVDYLTGQSWPADRVDYVANFVDAETAPAVARDTLATPDDAPLLLAAGRLHPNKGFDVLIRALAELPEAYLWLAGEGDQRAALEALAARGGVADRIRFLGWRRDVPGLMAAADMLVCPSRIEPLGNVVIEAWARHLPVVAASSAGPSWLIESGTNGLLAPVDDVRALTAALRRVISDPALAARLAKAGHAAYLEQFTEDAVVGRYLALFEKVAG